MNRKAFALIVIFVVAVAFLCAPRAPVVAQTPADIRLTTLAGSIGSAIHIGNGYAITAEHVVAGGSAVQYQTSRGAEKRPVDVLWASAEFDVALIRLRDAPRIAAAPVTCRAAIRGEPIKAYGNPLGLPFFETSGMISIAIPATIDRWKSSIVFSAPIAGGMSGGPLLDAQGHLLGIIVGSVGQVAPFGVAVPVATICTLLGRA